jgi:ribosomal protein S21
MVVVKKKQGESVDTLMHRFNKQTREEDIKWDVERRKRYMRSSDIRVEKTKRKQRKVAMQRRRRLQA